GGEIVTGQPDVPDQPIVDRRRAILPLHLSLPVPPACGSQSPQCAARLFVTGKGQRLSRGADMEMAAPDMPGAAIVTIRAGSGQSEMLSPAVATWSMRSRPPRTVTYWLR